MGNSPLWEVSLFHPILHPHSQEEPRIRVSLQPKEQESHPPFLNTWTSPQHSRAPEYSQISSSAPSTCDETRENTVSVTASSALRPQVFLPLGTAGTQTEGSVESVSPKEHGEDPFGKGASFSWKISQVLVHLTNIQASLAFPSWHSG